MTEIVAMVASLIIASFFTFYDHGFVSYMTIIYGAILTTIVWVAATFLTPATDDETLRNFYTKIRPGGSGWNAVLDKASDEGVHIGRGEGGLPLGILCMLIGTFTVYAALFATGSWIYGETTRALILTGVTVLGGVILFRAWDKISGND